MNESIFYQVNTQNQNAVTPIILYSEKKWSEQSEALSSYEKNIVALNQFTAKVGEFCLILTAEGVLSKVLVGGAEEPLVLASVVTRLPAGSYALTTSLSIDVYLSWSTAQYHYTKYKDIEILPRILMLDEVMLPQVLNLAASIFLVRDLINAPANHMGPNELISQLALLAKRYNASYREWIGDTLLDDNYPAIYTVGNAAEKPPCLGYLCYGDPAHPHVTLVGKGVTFDSGGLDIKSSANMRLMKKDMGGAAHVIGLANWIMASKLPVYLQVYVPAVENAVGSRSYRAGDIITMRNGLTVEIENTDAEGRLILADVLSKACENPPELLIDFATLTGAARIAVGAEIAAMFTPNDTLADQLMQASMMRHDPVWRLPLYAGYNHMFASSVADLMNASASAYAGAITAALFLQRFVKPGVPWVHFDMMAWNLASKPGRPEGGEAMGLLAVIEYLQTTYSSIPVKPARNK